MNKESFSQDNKRWQEQYLKVKAELERTKSTKYKMAHLRQTSKSTNTSVTDTTGNTTEATDSSYEASGDKNEENQKVLQIEELRNLARQ